MPALKKLLFEVAYNDLKDATEKRYYAYREQQLLDMDDPSQYVFHIMIVLVGTAHAGLWLPCMGMLQQSKRLCCRHSQSSCTFCRHWPSLCTVWLAQHTE